MMLYIFYFFSTLLILMNIRIYMNAILGRSYKHFNFLLLSLTLIGVLLTPYHLSIELILYVLFGTLYANFIKLSISDDISDFGIKSFILLILSHASFMIYANNYQSIFDYWR